MSIGVPSSHSLLILLATVALLLLLCAVACAYGSRGRRHGADDESDDDDDDDDEEEGYEGGGSQGGGSQLVLVECGERIASVHVRTSSCASVRQLRSRIAEACADFIVGVSEDGMALEWIDESAGLAITCSDESDLEHVLSVSTLKATFEPPHGGGAVDGSSRGRGRRPGRNRHGYSSVRVSDEYDAGGATSRSKRGARRDAGGGCALQ